ncbi:MAG: hypothetical protein WC777_02165 [Candidatus Gracilibacteria bacterium]|jgi:hypothetical protein
MNWIFWLLVSAELISVSLCFWSVYRLYKYIRAYCFAESVYTLLFGFVRLRYFVYAYLTIVFLATIAGFIFAFSLLNHDFSAQEF